MQKVIIKRDGSEEAFDEAKIARVTTAAGLEAAAATQLASKIASWVNSLPEEKVTSLQLRDKVLVLLRQADEYAANMFEWYQKTKEPSN